MEKNDVITTKKGAKGSKYFVFWFPVSGVRSPAIGHPIPETSHITVFDQMKSLRTR